MLRSMNSNAAVSLERQQAGGGPGSYATGSPWRNLELCCGIKNGGGLLTFLCSFPDSNIMARFNPATMVRGWSYQDPELKVPASK